MAWTARLVSLGAEGEEYSTDVLQIARPGDLTDLASLGLTLAEGKRLLAGIQQEIVAAQARVHARWLSPKARIHAHIRAHNRKVRRKLLAQACQETITHASLQHL